jgi:hypothetical protein
VRSRSPALAALAALAAVACATATTRDGTDPPSGPATASTSAAPPVAGPTEGTAAPPVDAGTVTATGAPPSILPVTYARPDDGTPLTATELAQATDELVALLKDTRWEQFVDERAHGWPSNAGGWDWATLWTGVRVDKAGGRVSFVHKNDGTDNAGIHTSPYLEGACWMQLLSGSPGSARLVRRLTRGMTSWILAMERRAGDTTPRILARSAYPPPVLSTEGGRTLAIDTSASRPGIDADPSDYIHHPDNPTLGDIWVKNRRSKDDIGHMLRAMTQAQACAPRVSPDVAADLAQTVSLYEAWAKDVDARGFVIPTRDASGNVVEPTAQLARYTTVGNVECVGTLAVRLFHSASPGAIDCQGGMPSVEALAWSFLKNDARQIQRTHHAAAVLLAFRRNALTVGLSLLQGLSDRVAKDVELATSPSPPQGFELSDAAGFMAYAAAVGVPLRSSEVRFVHGRLHQAYVGIRAPQLAVTFRVFDPSTPDGTYSYDPPNVGLYYRELALLLGSCASPYRNPAGRPLLDCARLAQALAG